MIIFDSNVWIAYFHETDSQHKKAVDIFEYYLDKKIIITDCIIFEVVTVLQNKADKQIINQFIEMVIENSDLEILHSSKDFNFYLLNFIKNNNYKKLSSIDQSLIILSSQYKIISFDEELNKALKDNNI